MDRATIVRAAIEILDREGLAALSMRRLGTYLNCGATTLYWHIANKEELLDLVFDEVMGELDSTPPPGDWRAQATTLMTQLRAMILRHPWYVTLYVTRPNFGPNALRFTALLLDILREAGFTGAALDHAQAALNQYVLGTAANTLSWRNWGNLPKPQLKMMRDYILQASQPYPQYLDYLRGYLLVTDMETMLLSRFETGLTWLLDGLAAHR
jgi:AcrR family transcriptional regulator